MKPEVGAFGEPLGVAYNGVHSLGDIIGKNVMVMGAGPIGILCAAAAKTLGADRVTIFDIRQGPLDIALQMGADEAVNSKDNPDAVKKFSEHKGTFDCALEATGNGFAAMQTMAMVRPEGTIAQVGMFGTGHQPTDLAAFSGKGLKWHGVFRFYEEFAPALAAFSGKGLKWHGVFRFYEEFAPAVNALESGIINPLPLLSASYPPEECEKALKAAVSPETCKVQIHF